MHPSWDDEVNAAGQNHQYILGRVSVSESIRELHGQHTGSTDEEYMCLGHLSASWYNAIGHPFKYWAILGGTACLLRLLSHQSSA
jgi:hypothetical protein